MPLLEPRDTKIFTVKNMQQAGKMIERAGELIREGKLVCFPTETVYGLGADALNDKAVADVFRAKNRSFENPIALHLHGVEEIEKYVKKINRRAQLLMEKFLPGPLMLLFEKNDRVPQIVTGGLRKVGIRVPRHDVCLEFLKECGTPVAATSANESGRLSCVKADDILQDLGGQFDLLLDAGNTPLGIESTVLDVTSDPPRIIRPGFITMEEIAVVIGIAPIFSDNVVLSSQDEPVEGSRHMKIVIIEGRSNVVAPKIKSYLNIYQEKGKKAAVIIVDETGPYFESMQGTILKMGSGEDPAGIARNIFETLRELENKEFDVVLLEGVPRHGLGRTLMIKLCQMADEVIKMGDPSESGGV